MHFLSTYYVLISYIFPKCLFAMREELKEKKKFPDRHQRPVSISQAVLYPSTHVPILPLCPEILEANLTPVKAAQGALVMMAPGCFGFALFSSRIVCSQERATDSKCRSPAWILSSQKL